MRIQKLTSAAIALVAAQLLWSAPVQATLISSVQNINAVLSADSPTYSGTFDLTSDGVPDSATVNWAVVGFTLLDFDGHSDKVSALLAGDELLSGISNPIGFSLFGGLLSGSVVSSLNTSGLLDYTLSFIKGRSSVIVSQGALVADVKSVPEPGTLSLLGAGLLAGWLGRKRLARA